MGDFPGRLAAAVARLTGERVAVFEPWLLWKGAPGGEQDPIVRRQSFDMTVLALPPELDPMLAATALARGVAWARQRFKHAVVDLTGLPLGYRPTLACADVVIPVAGAGVVRADDLRAIHGSLPGNQVAGVVLIG